MLTQKRGYPFNPLVNFRSYGEVVELVVNGVLRTLWHMAYVSIKTIFRLLTQRP